MPKRQKPKPIQPTEMVEIPRIFSEAEIGALLACAAETRYPIRNRAIVLLATDAGLAPNEIARIKRWSVQSEKGFVMDAIDLVSKTQDPRRNLLARTIPMPKGSRLRKAIAALLKEIPAEWHDPLIISERAVRGGGATKKPGKAALDSMRPSSISYIFWKLCEAAGLAVPGGQVARRTFVVKASRVVRRLPGTSLRDVQAMTGHRSLLYMQKLVEVDTAAQRLVVENMFDRGAEVPTYADKPARRRSKGR